MNRSWLTGQRLVVLFLLGCVLLNFPVLGLFERAARLLGVPVLYAWIYGVWLLLIAAMAFIIEHRAEPRPASSRT